eukprot:gene1889-33303_t
MSDCGDTEQATVDSTSLGENDTYECSGPQRARGAVLKDGEFRAYVEKILQKAGNQLSVANRFRSENGANVSFFLVGAVSYAKRNSSNELVKRFAPYHVVTPNLAGLLETKEFLSFKTALHHKHFNPPPSCAITTKPMSSGSYKKDLSVLRDLVVELCNHLWKEIGKLSRHGGDDGDDWHKQFNPPPLRTIPTKPVSSGSYKKDLCLLRDLVDQPATATTTAPAPAASTFNAEEEDQAATTTIAAPMAPATSDGEEEDQPSTSTPTASSTPATRTSDKEEEGQAAPSAAQHPLRKISKPVTRVSPSIRQGAALLLGFQNP